MKCLEFDPVDHCNLDAYVSNYSLNNSCDKLIRFCNFRLFKIYKKKSTEHFNALRRKLTL